VGVPPTNTASIWFAAPPSSPESSPSAATFTPLSCSGSTKCSDLPAGTYTIEATYRTASCASSTGTVCSNYGETPPCDAAGASPTCTTSQEQVTISAGQEIQITVGSAPQGVTKVAFYLLNTTGTGVNTGYIGQVAAPVGSPTTFTLSGSGQGVPSASAPTANTTYSSWCSTTDTAAGFSSGDTAVCADRLIWAPPASCTCTESQIAGTFYVKGSNENSAMEGNIYWPGAPTVPSAPASNQSGCQYSANGVGGLLGEVVCDSIFIQGGSSAGEATIGYSSGANLGVPPEVQLIE
jgi:hypothetical protein